jgi:hypothetical protein
MKEDLVFSRGLTLFILLLALKTVIRVGNKSKALKEGKLQVRLPLGIQNSIH